MTELMRLINQQIGQMKKIMLIAPEELNACQKEEKMITCLQIIVCGIMQYVFDLTDHSFASQMQEKGYFRERNGASRAISFVFGDFLFSRACWKNKQGKFFYPVDYLLGISPRQRFSPLFEEKIQLISTCTSYAKTSEVIQLLTGTRVSKTKVMKLVHAFGKKAKNYFQYESNYSEERIPKKKVALVKIEGDGVMFREQSQKKVELHHFGVWETRTSELGVDFHCVHEVVSPRYQDAKNRLMMYLHANYHLAETSVLTNGDGGKGYRYENFKEFAYQAKKHEHFIDRYHVTRKLNQRLYFAKFLITPFQKAICAYDWEKIQVCLDTAEANAFSKSTRKQVRKLKHYLKKNWVYLKPYRLRGLPIVGLHLGAMEGLHRRLTDRMKRLGRTWSKNGMYSMAQLIMSRRNGTFRSIVQEEWKASFWLDDQLKGDTSYLTVMGSAKNESEEASQALVRGRITCEEINQKIRFRSIDMRPIL